MEVEMKIRGLMMDPVTNMPIVILRDVSGNSVLPIWVGVYEANAIALEIEKVSTPRPMTHDLIKSLLLGLNTALRKVVVSELKDDTFYAVIWLDRDGEIISVDSRPSDALALALRLDCPIYVEETVLKSSSKAAKTSDKDNKEELKRWLDGLNDGTSADTRCDAGNRRASGRLWNPVGRRIPAAQHVHARPLRGACQFGRGGCDGDRQFGNDDGNRPGVSGLARRPAVSRRQGPRNTGQFRAGGRDSEVFFGFETRLGRGSGRRVARLSPCPSAQNWMPHKNA